MRTTFKIMAMAITLAGCDFKTTVESDNGAVTATSAKPLSQAEAEKIVGGVHASYTGGDAFKVMEHYAPGALIFDGGHVDPTADRATQTKWTADFMAMKPSDLVSTPRQVQVLDADTIVASGIAAFLADVGGHRQRLSTRYSQVFQRQADGSWKIVHEHMSLPPAPAGALP